MPGEEPGQLVRCGVPGPLEQGVEGSLTHAQTHGPGAGPLRLAHPGNLAHCPGNLTPQRPGGPPGPPWPGREGAVATAVTPGTNPFPGPSGRCAPPARAARAPRSRRAGMPSVPGCIDRDMGVIRVHAIRTFPARGEPGGRARRRPGRRERAAGRPGQEGRRLAHRCRRAPTRANLVLDVPDRAGRGARRHAWCASARCCWPSSARAAPVLACTPRSASRAASGSVTSWSL